MSFGGHVRFTLVEKKREQFPHIGKEKTKIRKQKTNSTCGKNPNWSLKRIGEIEQVRQGIFPEDPQGLSVGWLTIGLIN